jgi:hypothetical protein
MNSINYVHTVQYIVNIVTKQNKASILSYIWYKSETNLDYSRILKDRGGWSLLILEQRKVNSFIQELEKIEAKRTLLIPDIRKIEAMANSAYSIH